MENLINSSIRLNSIGYFPFQQKKSSIAAPCTSFSIIEVNSKDIVFKGLVSAPIFNKDTEENIYIADFSEVTISGKYFIRVDGLGDSFQFEIGDNIYVEPLNTVMLGMYLWRCGTEVSATYKGVRFSHEACHLEDAWMDYAGGGHKKRKSIGGWHDAGDYNKYVVNAGISLCLMFMAWEQFGDSLKKIKYLKKSKSDKIMPQYLQECKWEIDWLLSMQLEDGSVSHKVSTKDFCGFILPEKETDQRYFSPWGTTATADFTALMAAASRVFKDYDKKYADCCLRAAIKSYEFLLKNPDEHVADLSEFKTGEYETEDKDHRLWAAAELWETTGNLQYLKDFENRAQKEELKIDSNFNWKNLKNMGMIRYFFSKRKGKDNSLLQLISKDLLLTAESMVENRNNHGYGRSLGDFYCWGANSNLLNQVLILRCANSIKASSDFINTALDAIGFIFGRNRYCRSFVTGVGFNPPKFPHDRRAGGDDIAEPWPGYMVGGPAENGNDYQDSQPDCRTNEIAINWNAALIYALSGFLRKRDYQELKKKDTSRR